MHEVDAIAAANGRDMTNFGRELVRTRPTGIDDTVTDLHQWRELGGTHFAVASMDMGLDSVEAHIDYFAQAKEAAT